MIETSSIDAPRTAVGLIGSITPEMLDRLDWEADRERIGILISQLLPLESLIPDIYGDWRPVVRDAVRFIGSHLSPGRLAPKLLEQIQLPPETPLEKRLIVMIRRMPSLQKIGQTVARDRHLDATFRQELSQLENAVDDVSASDIRTVIEDELGGRMLSHQIEVEKEILAEASVSAVIRFTYVEPEVGRRKLGVFKVLKSHIRDYFSEELDILSGLAEFFDANRERYGLSEINLSDLFNDFRQLLQREVDFSDEQATLKTAARRYSDAAGIRIPKLIESLSTTMITAMSDERGIKVTSAFRSPRDRFKRRRIASRLIEALVAIPLVSPDSECILHADPHAGNLFVDTGKCELLLFDWALTAKLSRPERRRILLLLIAVALRDRRLINRILTALCENDLTRDRVKTRILRDNVRDFLDRLPRFRIAGVTDALSLVDQLTHAGIAFSSSLMIFRKVLFTLDGVLHDIMPGMRIDPTLVWYVAMQRARSSSGFQRLLDAPPREIDLPLSRFDQFIVAWSAQFFCVRAVMQAGRGVRRFGLRKLQSFLNGKPAK